MSRRSSPDPMIRRQVREATLAAALQRVGVGVPPARPEHAQAEREQRELERRELALLRAFWRARYEAHCGKAYPGERLMLEAEANVRAFYLETQGCVAPEDCSS